MSVRELIGQHMLIGISGATLTAAEKKFIVENNISGVVLFARNCIEPKQIRDLCAEIQSLREKRASATAAEACESDSCRMVHGAISTSSF